MLKTCHGSCHCGAVRFEANLRRRHRHADRDDVRRQPRLPRRRRSDAASSGAPITYVDGRNDRWQSAPEFFAL